jgi:hypothetical protein
MQPLHNLSVTLATNAVTRLGKLFDIKDWAENKKTIIKIADTELFVHPMYTDWMDEAVITWCSNRANYYNVRMAYKASILLWGIKQGLHETQELMNEVPIIASFQTEDAWAKSTNADATPNENSFRSKYAKQYQKWKATEKAFLEIWEQQGLQQVQPVTKATKEDNIEKEKGW